MNAMDARTRSRQLGAFVRAHRERLKPEGVAGRRRTPGLRREELAARAGISVTWCTFIEQGRGTRASPQALARLAGALALTRAERAYFFELAGQRDPEQQVPDATTQAPASLEAAMRAVKVPAYGLDPLWNACAWNRPAQDLFPGWLGRGEDRNLLRFTFLERSARRLIPRWEERARRLIAEFRADYSRRLGDPRMDELVARLCRESALFAGAWQSQDVLAREGGLREFTHPARGRLRFTQHTFAPADRPDCKLVILMPD